MFLRKEIVKVPTGPKTLIHYCRDCECIEIETIQTCKNCGGHNIANPFYHTLEDYRNDVGVIQETEEVTRRIYKCDLCGKEFDGFKTDSYFSYADGSFETCNYNNFSDAENVDFINYRLEQDLCSECKSKIRTHLAVKLIDFTREKNINNIINEYIKSHKSKEE